MHTTNISSSVYVFNTKSDLCNFMVGNKAFLVLLEMMETAAPVSSSIDNFWTFTNTSISNGFEELFQYGIPPRYQCPMLIVRPVRD